MISLTFINGTESAVQAVYLTILLVFFVLVLLSWWLASRDWFKDEIVAAERYHEQMDQQDEPK